MSQQNQDSFKLLKKKERIHLVATIVKAIRLAIAVGISVPNERPRCNAVEEQRRDIIDVPV